MCGISAVFKYNHVTEQDKENLYLMNKEMIYRGPDDTGVWNNEKCGLAHTRLSIIGIDNGHQPIFNEDKSLVLVCNGEIYNYKEIASLLITHGHRLNTRSDSEVIIHLYEDYDTDCLQYLRGMFAFCLYDIKRNKLFVARDRIGEKTLYYANVQCGIVFSTELKAIKKYYIDKPQTNVRLLAESIRFGFPIELKHTYIEQINRLQPGEYAIVDNKGVEMHTYWNRKCLPVFNGTIQEAKEKILCLMRESVINCLQSDVPIAVLLSGGIDSSAIAQFAKETGKEIHCISAGYHGNYNCDERTIAKKFAKEIGIIYHEVELNTDDFQDIFSIYHKYLDEPVTDLASIAQFALYKKAKELGFRVLLGGLGGDELFYGYPHHNRCGEALKVREALVSETNILTWLNIALKNPKFFYPKRKIRIDDRWPVDWNLNDYNSFANSAEFIVNSESTKLKDIYVNYNYPYHSDIDTVYDMLFSRFMTSQCLYLADRLGMANSVELRSPLVDYKLVEFVSSLPQEMKYTPGKAKQFMKDILSGIVPQEILYGPKKGFTPPTTYIEKLYENYTYNYFRAKHKYFNSVLADKILTNVFQEFR